MIKSELLPCAEVNTGSHPPLRLFACRATLAALLLSVWPVAAPTAEEAVSAARALLGWAPPGRWQPVMNKQWDYDSFIDQKRRIASADHVGHVDRKATEHRGESGRIPPYPCPLPPNPIQSRNP